MQVSLCEIHMKSDILHIFFVVLKGILQKQQIKKVFGHFLMYAQKISIKFQKAMIFLRGLK